MKKQFRLTKEGADELSVELKGHVSRRPEIAQSIKTAREQGDLTENAEYHAAKDDQERTELRIAEIEHILANAELIKMPKGSSKVQLGSRVSLKNDTGKTKEFQVVGTVEADPLQGKISDESPIGKVLLGKKVDDKVELVTSTETTTYKIVKIS